MATNLCGADILTTEYVSSGRYILVTFTSDSTGVSQGFQMTYFSVPDTCEYKYIILYVRVTLLVNYILCNLTCNLVIVSNDFHKISSDSVINALCRHSFYRVIICSNVNADCLIVIDT